MNEKQPELVVDDDWKSKVEKEKEQLARDSGSKQGAPEYPPAEFSILVSSYATQALMALGIMPDPYTQKVESNRPLAKHLIDMLGVIDEKTKGNLSSEEQEMMTETLHQLRLMFLSPPPAMPSTAPEKPKSSIILE
jgi:Domain of unknown function (DUF1844)